MKAKVSVTIDQKIYEKAHSLGLNVSKIAENALQNCIDALEHRNAAYNQNLHKKAKNAGPLGFEPRTFSLEGWRGTAGDWAKFREWLKQKKYSRTWESTLYNYAVEYGDCLASQDLSRLRDLSVSKRPNVLKALSALAKFQGCYESWKGLVKDYGFKWGGRSKSDVFIDRLVSADSSEEIWVWIRKVKKDYPRFECLLDLMADSGLRLVEAVNSFNLIVSLSKAGKLDTYFVSEKSALEHYRFKSTFIRASKKAFVSFVPASLVKKISGRKLLPNASAVSQRVQRRGFHSRFKDIRKANATLLTAYLKPAEIDFLHGRVTASIFMTNYFNPALISDLKERVFQGIEKIEEKTKV